jgi:hypothetical protein
LFYFLKTAGFDLTTHFASLLGGCAETIPLCRPRRQGIICSYLSLIRGNNGYLYTFLALLKVFKSKNKTKHQWINISIKMSFTVTVYSFYSLQFLQFTVFTVYSFYSLY